MRLSNAQVRDVVGDVAFLVGPGADQTVLDEPATKPQGEDVYLLVGEDEAAQ